VYCPFCVLRYLVLQCSDLTFLVHIWEVADWPLNTNGAAVAPASTPVHFVTHSRMAV
jgi:hypothetical protein